MEFVYTANDDGSQPLVISDEIDVQKNFISTAFSKWNISWEFSTRVIKSTRLNRALYTVDCHPEMVGKSALVFVATRVNYARARTTTIIRSCLSFMLKTNRLRISVHAISGVVYLFHKTYSESEACSCFVLMLNSPLNVTVRGVSLVPRTDCRSTMGPSTD